VLQRLDDGVEQVAAAAHQHQHVAIGKTAAVAEASGHGAAGDEPPDLGLDAFRQLDLGARQRHAIERRAPALDVLLLIGDRKLPEVDLAWTCIG
jgi:hypothetical protein